MSLFREREPLDDMVDSSYEIAQRLPNDEHFASAIIAASILIWCQQHNIDNDDFMARMIVADKLARSMED